MSKNLNIIVVCANGVGTSLMMKMAVEKAFKELGIPVERIHHCALEEGKKNASQYDLVFVSLNFITMFKDLQEKGTTIIGLNNILSTNEIKEKLKDTIFVPK